MLTGDRLQFFLKMGEGGEFSNFGLFSAEGSIVFILGTDIGKPLNVENSTLPITGIVVDGARSVEELTWLIYGGC